MPTGEFVVPDRGHNAENRHGETIGQRRGLWTKCRVIHKCFMIHSEQVNKS